MISFVMVLYLYISQIPLGLPWYVWVAIIMALIPILLIMDMVFIWPSELEYGFGKHPKMKALEKKVQDNNKLLKEIKEKLL